MPLRNPALLAIAENSKLYITGKGLANESIDANLASERVNFVFPLLLGGSESIDANVTNEGVGFVFPLLLGGNESIDANIITEGVSLTIVI